MECPSYFESVRAFAGGQWEQLEADPRLAGPWHQLFKQVQNPRHVISELLQNADDASATEASVHITDNEFVFCHNGEDFTEEHFASLCSFGYSNKRRLHTIGFRGIGFKSTFSLGDEVFLHTPTLSVAFYRDRFTLPFWLDHKTSRQACTMIRVCIADGFRRRQLEKNLEEWLKSPASLLFFHHIRRFVVGDAEVHWQSDAPGPVGESEWMQLSSSSEDRYLVIRSAEKAFPAEALAEIQQERIAPLDEEAFPPCRVEIVLGMDGRLFAVLPTGVKTALPFACNAPFIQDPAREKIKNPETSPTNRWLLKRVGELAAETMLHWLGRSDMDLGERAGAYQLFPDVDREDNTLEGSCATIAGEAFGAVLKGRAFLLGEDGSLAPSKGSVAVPSIVLRVWSPDQVTAAFLDGGGSILCSKIRANDVTKLRHWGVISGLGKAEILAVLEKKHLPMPLSWPQLLSLWSYLAPDIAPSWGSSHTGARIVPAEGRSVLHAGTEVVRLGDKRDLHLQDDWEFLGKYLLVVNQDWLRFIEKQGHDAEQRNDAQLGEQVSAAQRVLQALDLGKTTDTTRIIELVGTQLFVGGCRIADCVRLAHISAALGAATPPNFQFVAQNNHFLLAGSGVVVDLAKDLDLFVDERCYAEHVLHPEYTARFSSCTPAQWNEWITSGRAKLETFVPLRPSRKSLWTQTEIGEFLRARGCEIKDSTVGYSWVEIEDWDFDGEHWKQWRTKASSDRSFWVHLVNRVLKQPTKWWGKALSARVIGTVKGRRGAISRHTIMEDLCPAWIATLRGLPCLQDTWGGLRQPAELLRRTPSTEAFLGIEPFVRAELDTEENRPLLKVLGVRDTPAGPKSIFERLRALAGLENAPIPEVSKWYQGLDQLIESSSTTDLQAIRHAFASERLILTENCEWASVSDVFLAPDEDAAPGAAIVHASVRHLALWPKVGVAPQPSADLAIAWLTSLDSGRALTPSENRRVNSLLARYPDRIWTECGRWLNMEGHWVAVTDLEYAISKQSLFPDKYLFSEVKQKTADLQMLRAEWCRRPPFSEIRSLAECIEERLEREPEGVSAETRPWLAALGAGLSRVILEDEAQKDRIRGLARRLAATRLQFAPGLETVPYLAGVPAGTPRRADAVWTGDTLYVAHQSAAKAAAPVALEIARVFNQRKIMDACKLCYERTPEFVYDYLNANFTLEAPIQPRPEANKGLTADAAWQAHPSSVSPADDQAQGQDLLSGPVENTDEATEVDEDETTEEAGEALPGKARQPRPKPEPSVMERFARANGFLSDSAGRFHHPDGCSILRIREAIFPWQLYSPSGGVLQHYWPKDHCLETSPLELEAEVWGLCEKHPSEYSLLLVNPGGLPVVVRGTWLKEMRDAGHLILHAASYRLVVTHGQNA